MANISLTEHSLIFLTGSSSWPRGQTALQPQSHPVADPEPWESGTWWPPEMAASSKPTARQKPVFHPLLISSQKFPPTLFRDLLKLLHQRLWSDTAQEPENHSWTPHRFLEAGTCHLLGEVHPFFNAQVRTHVAVWNLHGLSGIVLGTQCVVGNVCPGPKWDLRRVQKLLQC